VPVVCYVFLTNINCYRCPRITVIKAVHVIFPIYHKLPASSLVGSGQPTCINSVQGSWGA